MRILDEDEILLEKDKIKKSIRKGAIFIYPTDTIYGIGCNANSDESVRKIRELKERPEQPFSVIAPSKDWILKNCEIDGVNKNWLDKLPGPFTFILTLINKKAVSKFVSPKEETLGVRIPAHWFGKIIEELDIPIVTTSVNKSGEEHMTCLEDLDTDIKKGVDYIFYEGKKTGRPSTIVVFEKGTAHIKER
jgi:L-threonylcarbamoyladenylate synthase